MALRAAVTAVEWDPPPEDVTRPDQIDKGALDALSLLDGERIVRCWQGTLGFLVMSNLRCVHVWRKRELFEKSQWQVGPSFFFYNLDSPRVVAGRFVQLSEQYDENGVSSRVPVRDPVSVCAEIEAARPAGRSEWERRRLRAQARLHHPARPSGDSSPVVLREVVREVVKVRCSYCGNLMDASAARCPMCGAPQR